MLNAQEHRIIHTLSNGIAAMTLYPKRIAAYKRYHIFPASYVALLRELCASPLAVFIMIHRNCGDTVTLG